MKKSAIVIILIALLVPYVSAFTITSSDGTVDIQTGANSVVKIAVNSDKHEQLTIGIVGEKPWTTLGNSQPVIEAGVPYNIELYLSPYIETTPGLYRFQIIAQSIDTAERKSADVYVNVKKGEGVIIQKMSISGETEPLGSAVLKIYVKNIGITTATNSYLNITVYSPSGVFDVSREYITSINPGEEKIFQRTISFPAGTNAGNYYAEAKIVYKDIATILKQDFEVEQKSIIKKTEQRQDSITGFKKTIIVQNLGNKVSDNVAVTESVSFFDSMFFVGYVPDSASGGYYTWNIVSVKPGEERVIYYEINYNNLYIFLIALLVASFIVLFFFRTVRIKKFIMQKKHIEEGEEFTIGIEIKNASGKNVNDIVIRDFVPGIFRIIDTEGVKPLKKKVSGGIELRWKLDNLQNREERIFTYKLVPVFGVHGRVPLSSAIVDIKFFGKSIEKKSNIPYIGVEAEENETKIDKLLRRKKKE